MSERKEDDECCEHGNLDNCALCHGELERARLSVRINDLEGALDDAMAEIRRLLAWRERAWQAMREAGVEAREIIRKLELEPPGGC